MNSTSVADSGPRVLIIDDDPQVRFALSRGLAREGMDVAVAADGAEGVQLHREYGFDVVVTDIVMAGQEGLETIQQLLGTAAKPVIIAISGGGRNSPDSYLKAAKLLGARRVLAKPFLPSELVQTIREIISE